MYRLGAPSASGGSGRGFGFGHPSIGTSQTAVAANAPWGTWKTQFSPDDGETIAEDWFSPATAWSVEAHARGIASCRAAVVTVLALASHQRIALSRLPLELVFEVLHWAWQAWLAVSARWIVNKSFHHGFRFGFACARDRIFVATHRGMDVLSPAGTVLQSCEIKARRLTVLGDSAFACCKASMITKFRVADCEKTLEWPCREDIRYMAASRGLLYAVDSQAYMNVYRQNGKLAWNTKLQISLRNGMIAVSDGEVFVLDTDNAGVSVLRARDGRFLRSFGTEPPRDLRAPCALCVFRGYAFVAETYDGVVVVYSTVDGSYVTALTGFVEPHLVGVSDNGILYVGDRNGISAVCVFGGNQVEVPPPVGPTATSLDPPFQPVVAPELVDPVAGDRTASEVGFVHVASCTKPPRNAAFQHSAGHLFVAMAQPAAVAVITLQGSFVRAIGEGFLTKVTALAVLREQLLVLDARTRIATFRLDDGTFVRRVRLSYGDDHRGEAHALIAGNGCLLLGVPNAIYICDESGVRLRSVDRQGSLSGHCVASNGLIFDHTKSEVSVRDLESGALVKTIGRAGRLLSGMKDICVSRGLLFVLACENIVVFSVDDGQHVATIVSKEEPDDDMQRICAADNGCLYITAERGILMYRAFDEDGRPTFPITRKPLEWAPAISHGGRTLTLTPVTQLTACSRCYTRTKEDHYVWDDGTNTTHVCLACVPEMGADTAQENDRTFKARKNETAKTKLPEVTSIPVLAPWLSEGPLFYIARNGGDRQRVPPTHVLPLPHVLAIQGICLDECGFGPGEDSVTLSVDKKPHFPLIVYVVEGAEAEIACASDCDVAALINRARLVGGIVDAAGEVQANLTRRDGLFACFLLKPHEAFCFHCESPRTTLTDDSDFDDSL